MGRHLVALATAAFAIVGVIGASPSSPSAATTGGWAHDAGRDYVGLAVFYDDDGVYSHECSGALVSDTAFVTAGHCTAGAATARIFFHGEIGLDVNPDTGFDRATGYPRQCLDDAWCVTSTALFDHGFDGMASFPDTRELGLVVLRAPPNGVSGRAQLPEPGTLDPLGVGAARNRTEFSVSGYGVPEASPLIAGAGPQARITATARITQLRSSLNDGFNLQSNGNASGFRGSCSGTSGAPVFLGDAGSDTIVAITSFDLGAWCRGTDLSYRLDRPETLDWIGAGYLITAGPAAG